MIELVLKRIAYRERYTIGRLYVDGEYFCDTIEDVVRELPEVCPNTPHWKGCACGEKILGETAIPAGEYRVVLRESPKFKRVLPLVEGVPHFLGILFHRGVDERSSSGCIIVGENKVVGKVLNSGDCERRLVERLRDEKDINLRVV